MTDDTFQLIETMLWRRGEGYRLLDRHFARLAASAAHFGFRSDPVAIHDSLNDLAATLAADAHRVRLLLAADGALSLSHEPIDASARATPLVVGWACRPVDSRDPLLRHKTTRRALFEEELARGRMKDGAEEVLFVNERGEVTEGSWTTLFVEIAGRLVTPPLAAGLLPGTLRQELLETTGLAERILRPRDVSAADRIFMGNSVRGLMAARLTPRPGTPRPAGSTGAHSGH